MRILQLYFDVFFRLKAVGVPVYVVVVPIGRCHGYRFYAEIGGQYIIRVLGVSIHGDGAATAGRHLFWSGGSGASACTSGGKNPLEIGSTEVRPSAVTGARGGE